jgi:carbonic anhydrase
MTNKLFLICPTFQLEPFLKEKYGDNSFFLTALGAVFNLNEITYLESVADFLKREAIQEIFIVHDTSCPFLRSVLEKGKGFGTSAERVLIDLLVEHYALVMGKETLTDKKKTLAELNIRRQADEILSNELLVQQIIDADLSIKGLITSKEENVAVEVEVLEEEAWAAFL